VAAGGEVDCEHCEESEEAWHVSRWEGWTLRMRWRTRPMASSKRWGMNGWHLEFEVWAAHELVPNSRHKLGMNKSGMKGTRKRSKERSWGDEGSQAWTCQGEA
jgi:hypothetical protein